MFGSTRLAERSTKARLLPRASAVVLTGAASNEEVEAARIANSTFLTIFAVEMALWIFALRLEYLTARRTSSTP